jgi:exo-1,4-beta-D-glucosaminidase
MFMIESGAASVPPPESLLQFMPHLANLGPNPGDDPRWPLDEAWAHYGGNGYYEWFDRGLRLMYGEPRDLADYCWKAHLTTYDQHRGFFEAVHHRMWDLTSGFGEWKINSSFPDIQWQLYDWYLRPMVSLYAIRKACAEFAVQLSALDQGVAIINNRQEPLAGLQVAARVYDAAARLLHEQTATVDVAANAYANAFTLAPPVNVVAEPLQFVKLELRDAAGTLLADNFYWLSPRLDDYETVFTDEDFRNFPSNKPWFVPRQTPCLPELADLPPVAPTLAASREGRLVTVQVGNDTAAIAFFMRARVLRDGGEVLPVYWSDNYISLLPGESKTLTAELPAGSGPLTVALDGWNITPVSVELT